MPSAGKTLALAAAVTSANAAFQGFNYGATFTNGALKVQSDYEKEFQAAQDLDGTDGAFNSARIYTMIQGNTANDPISAIPAAIKTKTSLLFGLWASGGDAAFNNEIAALKNTINQYCDQLDGLVAGISVGSEDLYRISPIGIANMENPGANPDTLVRYIGLVRDTIKGSCLSDAPIGHVDTWTAYANSSNSAVVEACDWVGMDAYAYFEDTKPNAIENGRQRFQEALDATKAAAGAKNVWVTETGWPVSGKTVGAAVPSPENAKTFWDDVGCPLFGSTNVWWYTLQDAAPDTPNPSFGVIGSEFTTKPIYDLTCDAKSPPAQSSSKSPPPPPASSKPAAPPSSIKESSQQSTVQQESSTKASSHASSVQQSTRLPIEEPTESSSMTSVVTPTAVPLPEPVPTTSAQTDSSPPIIPVPGNFTVPVPTSGGSATSSAVFSILPVPNPSGESQTTPGSEPTGSVPSASSGAPAPPSGETPTNAPGQPGSTGTSQSAGGEASQPTSTPPAQAGSTKLNSLGAAAVAILLAVGLM